MLDETTFDTMFTDGLRSSAHRWEALPAYEVGSDKGSEGSDYRRYLAGADMPTRAAMQSWLEQLRNDKARGLYRHRVRLLHDPRTNYERYECEWGYAFTGPAGEDIRIIDPAEHQLPPGMIDHDYWLLDDEHAIRMHYAEDGQYLSGSLEPDLLARDRAARDAAWAAAEPFESWWAGHPEHHATTARKTGAPLACGAAIRQPNEFRRGSRLRSPAG